MLCFVRKIKLSGIAHVWMRVSVCVSVCVCMVICEVSVVESDSRCKERPAKSLILSQSTIPTRN